MTTRVKPPNSDWGRPVLRALCDHDPRRVRIFDTDKHEIDVELYECRRCHRPMFRSVSGRIVEPFRAEECGCTTFLVCSFHAHPVHGGAPA